jgi:hypothetical protein
MRNAPPRLRENAAMEPVDGAISAQRQSHGNGLCESLLVLVLYGLVPCDAFAADQSTGAKALREAGEPRSRMQLAEPSFPAPFALAASRSEPQIFSATEFRPRKRGLLDEASPRSAASVIDAPMRRDTSLAREIAEFKTQDRVRLLTLWQNRASSLSLQAGKRGMPSLQWSTPWMHPNATSRGVFDRLLTVSPRSFGGSSRGSGVHPASALGPVKPLDLAAPINSK